MSRVITFGEILLRLTAPRHQRFIQAQSFAACYGGSEANRRCITVQLWYVG